MSSRSDKAVCIAAKLTKYEATRRALPGLTSDVHRETLARQLVDSARRTDYVRVMRARDISPHRTDPSSTLFDPVLAAISHSKSGSFEEACWLTFLSVQFGKHRVDGWNLCRAVYGRLGSGPVSSWSTTVADPKDLCSWIEVNADQIRNGPPRRRFGNHRKYESLKATGMRGTPNTIRTYVRWVQNAGGHQALIADAVTAAVGDQYRAFDILYKSMSSVASFGRLGRFDYLSMLGKIGLASIAAGKTYVQGSTGPLAGAELLFRSGSTPKPTPESMEEWLRELAVDLGLTMQDVEDAVCNWHKSPSKYKLFRG